MTLSDRNALLAAEQLTSDIVLDLVRNTSDEEGLRELEGWSRVLHNIAAARAFAEGARP